MNLSFHLTPKYIRYSTSHFWSQRTPTHPYRKYFITKSKKKRSSRSRGSYTKSVRNTLSSRKDIIIPKALRNLLGTLRTARSFYRSFIRGREGGPVKALGERELLGRHVEEEVACDYLLDLSFVPLQLKNIAPFSSSQLLFLILNKLELAFKP